MYILGGQIRKNSYTFKTKRIYNSDSNQTVAKALITQYWGAIYDQPDFNLKTDVLHSITSYVIDQVIPLREDNPPWENNLTCKNRL